MFEKDLSVVILRPDALKMQPVSAVRQKHRMASSYYYYSTIIVTPICHRQKKKKKKNSTKGNRWKESTKLQSDQGHSLLQEFPPGSLVTDHSPGLALVLGKKPTTSPNKPRHRELAHAIRSLLGINSPTAPLELCCGPASV